MQSDDIYLLWGNEKYIVAMQIKSANKKRSRRVLVCALCTQCTCLNQSKTMWSFKYLRLFSNGSFSYNMK